MACTSRMLDQHEELNCLPRPRRDIAHTHSNIYDSALPKADAGVGCNQNENWAYDFVPFPDMMGKRSLQLNCTLNQFASVTFAVTITYTHVCTRELGVLLAISTVRSCSTCYCSDCELSSLGIVCLKVQLHDRWKVTELRDCETARSA